MITAFIVTKDRACQLRCLLESLERNAFGLFDKLLILWKGSTKEYKDAYWKLWGEICKWEVNGFVCEELNFCKDFIEQLEEITTEYIMGLTDDTIFYRPLTFKQEEVLAPFCSNTLCASLRLGQNTTVQDPATGSPMLPIPQHDLYFGKNSTAWKWPYNDYPITQNIGYSISLDGHIYQTKDLLDLTKSIQFKNLREWEGELIARQPLFKKELMYCFDRSYCVNVSLNMVQHPFYETTGPNGVSIKELNDRYLAGESIDLDETLKDVNIVGSHQNMAVKFKSI